MTVVRIGASQIGSQTPNKESLAIASCGLSIVVGSDMVFFSFGSSSGLSHPRPSSPLMISLAAFAFGVIQPTSYAQRFVKIIVNGLKVHRQTEVHPTLQLLNLQVWKIGVILASK
jgi:hypothetical protein